MKTTLYILLAILGLIILLATIIGYGTWSFSKKYKNEVSAYLQKSAALPDSLLTEADMQTLPEPVKKYLRYTGAVNKPKVKNFKVAFEGQIRKDELSPWMPFTSLRLS